MSKDDQFASYDSRLKSLAARVAGLEGAIINDTKYASCKQVSLEERTEPRKANDKRTKSFEECIADCLDDYNGLPRRSEEAPMGCQGDQLGQCKPGCDGVSERGSCLDDYTYNEEGKVWAYMDGGFRWATMEELSSLSPVDNEQSCSIEDELRERIAELEATKAGHDNKIIDKLHETINRLRDKVMDAQSVKGDSSVAYSNKPRREQADLDDVSIDPCLDSGLEGSSEGRDSEQKANMSDKRAKGRVWGLSDGVSCDCFTLGLRHVALPAVVYCCNGAMYEAR